MPVNSELIEKRYDALMFAKSAPEARAAAKELVRVVLGDEALEYPLADALRKCCTVLRPARDERERQRYEAEFVELGIWPNQNHRVAA